MSANNTEELEDPRRVANRLRDAYTLTEAEGILRDILSSEKKLLLDRIRKEVFKEKDLGVDNQEWLLAALDKIEGDIL